MGYIPVRRRLGNQLYLIGGLFAHNLVRDLQMATMAPSRRTTANRAALWTFEQLDTIRMNLLCRAGKLTRPQGVLTLTLNANSWLRRRLNHLLQTLQNFQSAA